MDPVCDHHGRLRWCLSQITPATSNNTIPPTADPTRDPTADPTMDPTRDPTRDPTVDPTADPTADPTIDPTSDPTIDPTADPTSDPTADPTRDPTRDPTSDPTVDPTSDPTMDPTADPTSDPTIDPTANPTSDPTSDPPSDPTSDPTRDPTGDPTKDPSTDPTIDPTADPTSDPTADPTIDPTADPTRYPIKQPCLHIDETDSVFLVDISGELNNEECKKQMEYIAEIAAGIKGPDSSSPLPQVRLALFEFASGFDVVFDLLDPTYNNPTVSPTDIDAMYRHIRGLNCGGGIAHPVRDLRQALLRSIMEFATNSTPARDRKVVIYSNNIDNQNALGAFIPTIQDQLRDSKIDVIMINAELDTAGTLLANYNTNSTYLLPITDYDPNRIFVMDDIWNVDAVVDELCSEPSPAPTPDP